MSDKQEKKRVVVEMCATSGVTYPDGSACDPVLFVRCNDGTMFGMSTVKDGWFPVPEVPQPE